MAGIGHNQGPTLEGGHGWRRHCWSAARAALLPVLPIEVVRLRVKRAAEIGLDYRTYASIRAASGHDVIALLFSSNALHLPLTPGRSGPVALPPEQVAKLQGLRHVGRGLLVQTPLSAVDLAGQAPALWDHCAPAPAPLASWSETRRQLRAVLAHARWPAGGVVLIGDTTLERDWVATAQLAHYLPRERFFAA